MSIICPTVTAYDAHDYRNQIERLQPFAQRIHIDLMDDHFAPHQSVSPIQAWWPDGVVADIHLMFQRPTEHIETIVSLNPHMVIIHAEADGDLLGFMQHIGQFGILTGVALLKESQPDTYDELISVADHVLLFSGSLGRQGGTADLRVLDKVYPVHQINSEAEMAWDGGANIHNVRELAQAGIDVINVGGAIGKSPDPSNSYATLVETITAKN